MGRFIHVAEIERASRVMRDMADAPPEDRDPQTVRFYENLTGNPVEPSEVVEFCDRLDRELAETRPASPTAPTITREAAVSATAKPKPRVQNLGVIDLDADLAYPGREASPRRASGPVNPAQAGRLQAAWDEADGRSVLAPPRSRPAGEVAEFARAADDREAGRLGISPARAAELRKLNASNGGI